MLFIAFRSKLAGLCVIMGVLAVLTSALPTPGDKQTQGEVRVWFEVSVHIPFDPNMKDGVDSIFFRNYATGDFCEALRVELPTVASMIVDPCVVGIPKLTDITSLSTDNVAVNVGKLYITNSQLERLIDGILEPDLPAYFEGGDDQAFVDRVIRRIAEHEGFERNEVGTQQYKKHKEKNAGYRKRLRKEKFIDKLSPEQKEQLARNPKASVC
ncbi:hypothetical protein EV360DRAFT_69979 [Lentinula raphanica]|nr:hypothetical protein EV360DRAFT_69979 [Lentinula raphanica]